MLCIPAVSKALGEKTTKQKQDSFCIFFPLSFPQPLPLLWGEGDAIQNTTHAR